MRAIDKDCMKAASSLGATPSRAFGQSFAFVTSRSARRITDRVCFVSWLLCHPSNSWWRKSDNGGDENL